MSEREQFIEHRHRHQRRHSRVCRNARDDHLDGHEMSDYTPRPERAYYNEIDPYAAQWLENLIAFGCIASGDVDRRSIVDVQPNDLKGYTQCHFFAGIGGWSQALKLVGWPDERPVWTGSCPCQPFSAAGKRRGAADERHLWPEFARLIAECGPPVVFGEQVASKDGRQWLSGVRADLEALGYAVGAADLCAAGAGSPHIRQRLYWLADAGSERRQQVDRGAPRNEEAHGRARREQREPDGNHVVAGGGAACGLANTGRRVYTSQAASADIWQSQANRPADYLGLRSELGGLADSDVEGRTRDTLGLMGPEADRRSEAGRDTFWSRYDVVHCTDGKARRFEPGSFPLAHGVSNRVGRLRGYGNAIVPQVAAEFIGASRDVIG